MSWLLNNKIESTENKITISQEAYIEKLIEQYKMSDCRTLETPLDDNSNLSKFDSPETGSKEYQELQSCDYYRGIVGCLNYLALTNRPDIAHTANILISFVENPGNKHWNAAKASLRYLKGRKSEKLFYRKCDKLDLKGYSHSDWDGNLDSRKKRVVTVSSLTVVQEQ